MPLVNCPPIVVPVCWNRTWVWTLQVMLSWELAGVAVRDQLPVMSVSAGFVESPPQAASRVRPVRTAPPNSTVGGSPAFFYGTVRENFQVAKPEATDDDIRRLCESTELWPILESNLGPNPLDQQFAAGKLLSGGQKKLFALTRCLLLDPTVLLLDEPTVGMGPLEKSPLIETMRKACSGKTVIVVDHDIVWQVRFCDHFLVLDGGKIVQQGTSEELLDRPGLFRELYDEATQRGPATETGARRHQEDVGTNDRGMPMTTGPPPGIGVR